MSTTLEPVKKTVVKAQRPKRLKSIKHIQDPYNPKKALCSVKIDPDGIASSTDPCVVCLKMANNQRMWQR